MIRGIRDSDVFGESAVRHLAKAQVHATLAHAAAVIDAAGPDVDTVHSWRGVSYQ